MFPKNHCFGGIPWYLHEAMKSPLFLSVDGEILMFKQTHLPCPRLHIVSNRGAKRSTQLSHSEQWEARGGRTILQVVHHLWILSWEDQKAQFFGGTTM